MLNQTYSQEAYNRLFYWEKYFRELMEKELTQIQVEKEHVDAAASKILGEYIK